MTSPENDIRVADGAPVAIVSFIKRHWRRVLCGIVICHYVIGVVFWAMLIYSIIRQGIRINPPDVAAAELEKWAVVVGARIWKCLLPLWFAILAFQQSRRRPLLSVACLIGVVCFTAVCSSLDISAGRWDMATFGPEQGHCEYYFTWWWHDACH